MIGFPKRNYPRMMLALITEHPLCLHSRVIMDYLPMHKLGAREKSPKIVQFGIFLPGVDSGTGYAVSDSVTVEQTGKPG
jgi:hypothetical protein